MLAETLRTPAAAAALYFAALVASLEWLRRRGALPPDVTRRLFFAGTALSALPAVSLPDRGTAIGIYLVLTALAYLSFRLELFHAIEDDGASLGSVLFPLSCALLLGWFRGDRSYLALAGIFGVGLGDTAAAVVGRRMGSKRFRNLVNGRSMEGTLAMFFACGLTTAPLLALGGPLGWHQAVAFALIAATVAASVEALSPYGSDNLTVPVATAAALAVLVRFSQ